jgi:hypothetical protein
MIQAPAFLDPGVDQGDLLIFEFLSAFSLLAAFLGV